MRTKKKSTKKVHLSFIWTTVIIFIGVFLIFYKISPGSSDYIASLPYSSQLLRFQITIPADFQVNEQYTNLSLSRNNEEIIITRTASQFTHLEDYISSLESKNNIKINTLQKLEIDGLNSIKGSIMYTSPENLPEQVFFIFGNGRVYTLSTSSQNLYDELDQIAHSFHYTP